MKRPPQNQLEDLGKPCTAPNSSGVRSRAPAAVAFCSILIEIESGLVRCGAGERCSEFLGKNLVPIYQY